jgi:hypothetical protein
MDTDAKHLRGTTNSPGQVSLTQMSEIRVYLCASVVEDFFTRLQLRNLR